VTLETVYSEQNNNSLKRPYPRVAGVLTYEYFQGRKFKMTKKFKVMTIFGTRPEAIKMAPLVLELKKNSEQIESIVTVTAQHRQMLDQVLETFKITPDYDLNIMKDRQTLVDVATNALIGLDRVMKEAKPDIVLVHGDTATTFVGSLAAFYNQIAIGHVEAGLRTGQKYSPYPEEMNRQLTGVMADLHFAPTEQSRQNLLKENKFDEAIYVTGNTAIDALKTTVSEDYTHPVLAKMGTDRMILLTAHRRENLGDPMRNMFRAIMRLLAEHDDIQVVYPVHMNPAVREVANEILGDNPRVHLIEPLEVFDFHNFAARSFMILTDSGGVQEEAPSLGKPVLVLRDTTERPEGIAAGTLKLAGTNEEVIYQMAKELLTDKEAYERMAHASNPYGDGFASQRIVEALLKFLNK
jgi:UDP-N-acetylglucosamine 2-epimerase (non-hydrolysing)